MGLFSPIVKSKPYGWSDKAPHLSGEDAGLLMEMESQIKAEQRREALIQDCATRLLAGDREWTWPLSGLDHWGGRQIEHAAIAEAFKALKGRE